jgi:hypothetical protein
MKNLSLWVLLTSILQFISPGISILVNVQSSFQNNDPMITPAGYAFIVWGLITFLGLGYGIYQYASNSPNQAFLADIGFQLCIIYTLFAVWLVVAGRNWLVLTVIIFVAMFYFLTIVFGKILQNYNQLTIIEKGLLYVQIAVYTGWATIAIFANTASAIKFYGVSDLGQTGMIWQALILLGALANSVFWLNKFEGSVPYALTIVWALVGVYVGLLRFDDTTNLKIISLSAVIFVIGLMFYFNKGLKVLV